MQGKHAKIVGLTQERAILGYLETTRSPSRDRVMCLVSMKAGLRAKEMASLTWAMVTDTAGQIAEALQLQSRASKGKTGGRAMPLHPHLRDALTALQTARGDAPRPALRGRCRTALAVRPSLQGATAGTLERVRPAGRHPVLLPGLCAILARRASGRTVRGRMERTPLSREGADAQGVMEGGLPSSRLCG